MFPESAPTARMKGFEALITAYAVYGEQIYLLSLVGSREAVRAIIAAWVRGGEDLFIEGKRYESGWSSSRRYRVERLVGKHYHGIGWTEGHYYAREENPRAERLWVSRNYGVPIPEELGIWDDVRKLLLMEGRGVVALKNPSNYFDALKIKGFLDRLKAEETATL